MRKKIWMGTIVAMLGIMAVSGQAYAAKKLNSVNVRIYEEKQELGKVWTLEEPESGTSGVIICLT